MGREKEKKNAEPIFCGCAFGHPNHPNHLTCNDFAGNGPGLKVLVHWNSKTGGLEVVPRETPRILK